MEHKQFDERLKKSEWQPMKLSYYSKVSDLVQVGNGKTIITTADPGEYKKVPVRG